MSPAITSEAFFGWYATAGLRFCLLSTGLPQDECERARAWFCQVFAHFNVSDDYEDTNTDVVLINSESGRAHRCDRYWLFHGWRLSVAEYGASVFVLERLSAPESAPLDHILPDVEIAVVNHVTERLAGKLWMHGACLVRNDDIVMLLGPSGVGKTTLSLGLAGQGFRLLTDDIIVFELSAATFVPFPRCPKVRPPAGDLLREIGLPIEHIARFLGRYVLLSKAWVEREPQSMQGKRVSVFFLRAKTGAQGEGVRGMSLSTAIIEISRFSNLLYRDPELTRFSDVFSETEFYSLSVGDLATNIRQIIGVTGVHSK